MRVSKTALLGIALSMLVAACGGSSLADPASAPESGPPPTTPVPGTIAIDQPAYTVDQSAGSVTVTVDREGGSNGAVTVDYATSDNTAVAGTDYTATMGTLSWADGDAAAKTFSVPISAATGFNGTKAFNLTLSNVTGGATLGTSAATVTITGAGVPGAAGSISLSASAYSVNQNGGKVTITVNRVGGSTGAASVDYATADDSAMAGTDYTAKSGTLNWADGDAAAKTFSVSVSNATPFSGTRDFTVSLSNVGGASMGTPSTATVTITGSSTSTQPQAGTLALSASSYSIQQSAGSVQITVKRTGGSSGAASVKYATSNGSAVSGTDYTSASGTLNWADGDSSAKTFMVSVSTTAFTGSKTFTATLSNASGSTLGSPSSATVTIAGSGSTQSQPGTVALSASSYSIQQTAGTVQVTVKRTGGSSGAASVKYATSNGSAASGTDYTSASGTLSWADADSSSKTFSVTVSTTAFTGSKTFTVTLSNASGATLGSPASATVTIVGSGGSSSSGCAQNSSSYTTTGAFDSTDFGNYVVNNNNWGGTPNQKLWANDQNCWGVTTSATTEQNSVSSYPSVTRGWSQNGDIMQQLSTAGTQDWTTKSGMGVQVSAITKAQIHWAFTAPTTVPNRWLGLMDIYFHSTNSPSYTQFPPVVDLMIDQSIMDQPLSDQPTATSTFYAATASQDHATVVTLGGVKYVVYIDDSDEVAYHSSGGHTIHLFTAPTTFSDGTGPSWGTHDGRHDLKAIINYFMQANPKDDSGNALKFANGSTVTSALISSSLYLNAINAGWEIDVGTSFTNTAFCVAMQSEPDCP